MPRSRRRRSDATPAQVWRVVRALAREVRTGHRQALAREAAYEERRRKEQEERDRQWQARLNRIAGDGDNRFGELMEALVEGKVVPLFREVGLDVERAFPRVRSPTLDEWREYDVVAVGIRDAVVVEVKTTLRSRDVSRFTDRIGDFREWRPDHARQRVWGALGYLSASPAAVRAAEAAGFYIIRVVSTTAELVNSEGFEPRVF